jgi:hypothetical protein
MAVQVFTWGRFVTLALVYWVVVVGGWALYRTRPTTPRRVRQRDVISELRDPVTGHGIVTVSQTVNLLPIAAVLFGPPVALLIAWWALK